MIARWDEEVCDCRRGCDFSGPIAVNEAFMGGGALIRVSNYKPTTLVELDWAWNASRHVPRKQVGSKLVVHVPAPR